MDRAIGRKCRSNRPLGIRRLGRGRTVDWRETRTDGTPLEDLTRFRGAATGRHVILIGLESTAAQYLGLHGADPDVMPNLSALAQSGIVFENAYATPKKSSLQTLSESWSPSIVINGVSLE